MEKDKTKNMARPIIGEARNNVHASVVDQPVSTPDAPAQQAKAQTTKASVKAKAKVILEYNEEQKQALSKVKEIADAAFKELLENDRIPTTPFSDHNAVIDLTSAINNGIEIYVPEVNRKHGTDQMLTGQSLLLDTPQTLLLVVSVKVAMAAGMGIIRFDNDEHKAENKPIEETGLVCINGNGRIDYILGLPAEERPKLYATLVEPDSKGFINVPRAMSAVNEHQSQWKTQDKLQKKILEDGVNADKNLIEIRKLVNRGYNYQAACQLVTLRPDRITSKELAGTDMKKFFEHANEAKEIRDALIEVFGEGEDKCLKNKAISRWVSEEYNLLLKSQYTPATACKYIVDFVKGLNKVAEIKEAKADKKKRVTRDTKRLNLLTQQFNRYIGQNGINIVD